MIVTGNLPYFHNAVSQLQLHQVLLQVCSQTEKLNMERNAATIR